MELPLTLREAVAAALNGVPLAALRVASARLSQRYRWEVRDGTLHLSDDLDALAYIGVRMPGTYAAIRQCFAWVAERVPAFAPATMLDAGAGPGTAVFAASDCWPGLRDADLVESSAAVRARGEALMSCAGPQRAVWRDTDLLKGDLAPEPRDLVTLAYVLDEVAPDARGLLIERLWAAAAQMLVLVEPGTPSGWTRILAARKRLIAAGAQIVAPCPHALPCPLVAPDWCHFARRLARSRMHRQIKAADVPFEDEKFIYLAAARYPLPAQPAAARILAPPMVRGGHASLKLCRPDGSAGPRALSRRDGAAFRAVKRLGWGDVIMPSDSSD